MTDKQRSMLEASEAITDKMVRGPLRVRQKDSVPRMLAYPNGAGPGTTLNAVDLRWFRVLCGSHFLDKLHHVRRIYVLLCPMCPGSYRRHLDYRFPLIVNIVGHNDAWASFSGFRPRGRIEVYVDHHATF